MVPFKCDVHGWMNAYVGVLDHPFFAVTDADGTFEIKGAAARHLHDRSVAREARHDDAERDGGGEGHEGRQLLAERRSAGGDQLVRRVFTRNPRHERTESAGGMASPAGAIRPLGPFRVLRV